MADGERDDANWVVRAYKFRFYPDGLEDVLVGQGHGTRALWNLLHGWYLIVTENRMRSAVSWADMDAVVKQARKDIPWLGDIPAQAAQQVVKAYVLAWRRYAQGKSGKPRFHARTPRLGIDVPQARDLNWKQESRKYAFVQLPKVGRVRVRTHRRIPAAATITGARVIRESKGVWYLVVRTKRPRHVKPVRDVEPLVGFDRNTEAGIPLAASDGQHRGHDDYYTPGEAQRLLRLERQGARQRVQRHTTRGKTAKIGRNERATYDLIGRVHARAKRRRLDWQHKQTHEIATTYATVGLENLHPQAMTKSAKGTVAEPGRNVAQKAGLNRAILNEGWAQFATLLAYKLEAAGGQLVSVPAPYTSLRCHVCQTITEGSRENQAWFVCKNPVCDWSGNADLNAAKNVEYLTRHQLGLGVRTVSEGPYSFQPQEHGGAARTTQHRGDNPVGVGGDLALVGSGKREQTIQKTALTGDLSGEAATFMWR